MKYLRSLLIAAIFLTSLSAFSQDLVTDRPDQTESSLSVPQGSLQIEAGFLFDFLSGDGYSEQIIAAPTMLFRYGLVKGLELRIGNEYISAKNKLDNTKINGIGDMELGLKVEILAKEDINMEIGFLSHVLIPTGSEQLSLGRYGTINKLAISHTLSDNLGLAYNIGYDYFGEGNGILTYSLVLGVGVGEKAGVYIEPYGELFDMKTYFSNIDAGMTYLVKENFQLDLSFGTGINHTMNYLSFGFSWRIDKK